MAQKKLMLLGGLIFQLPVIEIAHKLGIYVITADYLPNNIAHKYSDEYCNVSIIDKEAVLQVAKDKQIDGIMSFACDPGVTTAAYVAEQMNLPFAGTYDAVQILQNKDLFRKFLSDNDFNVPYSCGYSCFDEAIASLSKYNFPIIVKPVDSAGSKGVTKVVDIKDFPSAFANALNNSISKRVIVEEFIELDGFQSSADCFSIDGKLVYSLYSDQIFDKTADNPYVPIAEIYPSTMALDVQTELSSELQRLIKLLNLKTGIYNVESRLGRDGKAYLMEVSPRGGGNHLALVQDLGCGQSVIENEVRHSVGMDLLPLATPVFKGSWASVAIQSNSDGFFDSVTVSNEVNVLRKYINVHPGDVIHKISSASQLLGDILVKTDSREDMDELIGKRLIHIHVNCKSMLKNTPPS